MRNKPWWLQGFIICGNDESENEPPLDEQSEEEVEEEAPESSAEGPDTNGLKSALQKERKAAKDATRALRQAQKELDKLKAKDQSEVERAQAAEKKLAEQAQKLSAGLLKTQLDIAIEREARRLKFIDTDDAIQGVDRTKIDYTQDEDNPADIEVDEKSIKAAVKALADRKKHLIGEPGSDDPSGSKFGGRGGNKNEQTVEDLKKKYSAL